MKIFISYRRDDSAGYAGRLLDYLVPYFGDMNVFMDIDAIEPGEDFREIIHKAVAACDVVLVMIGQQWLNIADAEGQRRLDNPRDLVRAEVASALANRDVRVIPVLIRRASMPGPNELPNDLQDLAGRNAFDLSDGSFRHDADKLIRAIKRIESKKPSPPQPVFWKITLGVVILGLLVGTLLYSMSAMGALLTPSATSTMTLTYTAKIPNTPASTFTPSVTPSPTPSPEILMMDQYYNYINNAGNSDDLKKAWDLLTFKLQCNLYEDCKFVHYKEWWWTFKVQYKLYDCGSMIIETELIFYNRDQGRVANATAPAYVKYWLVNDHGQLKIDSGMTINQHDSDCTQVFSSQ